MKEGYYINWESPISLHNWVEDLNLRCSTGFQIGFFASSFFIGHVLGTTLLARYGDIIGRIKMIRIGITFTVAVYAAILIYTKVIVMNYAFLFILGFFSNVRINLGYLYG